VDRAVAGLNIAHYRRLLAGEIDAARRQTILRLLAEEEAKLAEPKPANKPADKPTKEKRSPP